MPRSGSRVNPHSSHVQETGLISVISDAGYLNGVHAPGHSSVFETPLVSHNLLRAHATAVQVYRAEGRHQIGLVVNIEPKYPTSDSTEDREATRRADAYMNRQFLDPVFLGAYPEELSQVFEEAWPQFPESDLRLVQEPIDFLGVNYYTRRVTRHDATQLPHQAGESRVPGATYTSTDWEIFPEGLRRTLTWIKERYGDIPLYVTENGAALDDPPTVANEPLPDPIRVQYYRDHLLACRQAMAQGVDLRGYFAWSLLDNYEWSQGYSKRFGIVHVNFETQKRTLKASAHFYRDVIQSRGANLGEAIVPDGR